jgi:hypothetical protein
VRRPPPPPPPVRDVMASLLPTLLLLRSSLPLLPPPLLQSGQQPVVQLEPGEAAAVVRDAARVLRAGGCPCQNATLCQPVARRGKEKVYAFHIGSISYCPGCSSRFTPRTTWRDYDWSQITTIGYQNWHSPGGDWPTDTMDPELLCHAHALNVRVTLLPPPTVWGAPSDWSNHTFVANATRFMVNAVESVFADGYDIDIEKDTRGLHNVTAARALTQMVAKAVASMHAANPHSHVTMATPSQGSGDHACGVMYGRLYEWKKLSQLVDFFVVMDCALRVHPVIAPASSTFVTPLGYAAVACREHPVLTWHYACTLR